MAKRKSSKHRDNELEIAEAANRLIPSFPTLAETAKHLAAANAAFESFNTARAIRPSKEGAGSELYKRHEVTNAISTAIGQVQDLISMFQDPPPPANAL